MFTFFIEFTYETKAGNTLHGKMECLNLFDADEILKEVLDWSDGNGYEMTKIEITKVGKVVSND